MDLLIIYLMIAAGMIILSAVISGYSEKELGVDDFFMSLFWPILFASILGIFIRAGVETYRKIQERKTQEKEQQALKERQEKLQNAKEAK